MSVNTGFTGWGRTTWDDGAWNERGFLTVTGVSASFTASAVTIISSHDIAVTGMEVAFSLGSYTIDSNVNTGFSGWGRQTWDSGAWDDAGAVQVTGVSASFEIMPEGWGRSTWDSGPWDEASPVAVITEHNIVPTGVEAESLIGSYSVSFSFTVGVTGTQSAITLGGYAVQGENFESPIGVQATHAIGTVSISGKVIQPSGEVVLTSGIGDYLVVIPEELRPAGTEAEFATGSVTIVEGVGVTVVVTGISSTITLATVSIPDQVIGVAGVSGTLTLGAYVQWGSIIPSQTPSWAQVSPSQSPGWTEITPSQTPDWTKIAA